MCIRDRAKDPQGQLKMTIAKFYRVNGSSTQHRGVQPDIAIPSVVDSAETGESAQKNALPWDEIAATRYRGDQRLTALADVYKRQTCGKPIPAMPILPTGLRFSMIPVCRTTST